MLVVMLALSGLNIGMGLYRAYNTQKRINELIDAEKDPKKKEELKKELSIWREKEAYYKSEYARKKKEFDAMKKEMTPEEREKAKKELKRLEKESKKKQKWWEGSGVPIWKI